jgi:CheY-like chemotaxis protein
MVDEKPENGVTRIAASITSVIDALSSLAKLAIVAVILVVGWENRAVVSSYATQWLNGATHVGFLGLSVDRQISADQTITKIVKRDEPDPNLPKINESDARGAIVRASRNAAAIVGSRILWVDDKPHNNDLEVSILSDMGIETRRALSTKEALLLLPGFAPDLIISNVGRDGDQREPLNNCPAHYFDVPPNVSVNLSELNKQTMAGTGKATGFSMAEMISMVAPDYTNHLQPRLIFYSASNGGIVANQCARAVINRVDILLQTVVSALEELRWPRLQVPSRKWLKFGWRSLRGAHPS